MRRGFTILEVLVVIGIIVVLFSFFMPATRDAREAARRTQCRNNLKQLGLALHSYHDSHKMFPPGVVSEYSPTTLGGCDYTASTADFAGTPWSNGYAGTGILSSCSGMTLILPFMEERALYNAYNMKLGCGNAANATSVVGTVKSLLCPSNRRGAEDLILSAYYQQAGAIHRSSPTDYVFCAGAAAILTCVSPYRPDLDDHAAGHWGSGSGANAVNYLPSAGMFNVNSNVGIRQIKDGTSSTIMMGEAAGGAQLPAGFSKANFVDLNGPGQTPSKDLAVDTPWSQGYIGGTIGIGGYGSVFAVTCDQCGFDSQFKQLGLNTVIPINETKLRWQRVTALPGSAAPEKPWDFSTGSVAGFRSYHAGTCHFLYADGTVKSLSESVAPEVYSGLSTINGRELVTLQ